MVQAMIVQLTRQHVDGWVDLYNRFHRPFSWILPMDMNDSSALLEEGPRSYSYVVLREQEAVAIATLDLRGIWIGRRFDSPPSGHWHGVDE